MRIDKIQAGEVLGRRQLVTIKAERVQIPDPNHLVHLQFRRFAACPFCNLHLQSFVRRHDEIVAAGIREVAVFHSSVVAMLPYQGSAPFAVIADPEKRLYAEFGVRSSLRAALDPRAWVALVRAVSAGVGPSMPTDGEGVLGLPADFLVATDGRVLACKYGVHAYDQWSVDDLLDSAREHIPKR